MILRDQGAVIEEAVDDEEGDDNEKSYSEKVDLPGPEPGEDRDVTEIHIGADGTELRTDVDLT